MNLIVHRGTHQIGGSCVEVQSGSDRILLDLGLPLVMHKDRPHVSAQSIAELLASEVLPRIDGVYANSPPQVRAVVMSHVHPDHIGLGPFIDSQIPIYATAGTWALHDVMQIFGHKPQAIGNRHVLPKGPITFGPLTVTAIPVDHSAPDAAALLVEADRKKLLYSGDFRAHGRKLYLWDKLLRRFPPGSIDVLLLEGTTIGRPQGLIVTEQALEPILAQLLSQQKHLALAFCSAQNLDRLVTIYKVVKRLNKIMVIDLYTAYTLRALSILSPNVPQWDWPGVRVICWKYQQESLERACKASFTELIVGKGRVIGWKGLKARSSDVVLLMRSNSRVEGLESEFGADVAKMQVIWSMWDGYWKDDQHIRPLCEKYGIQRSNLHTSGHAAWQDIKDLVAALQPKAVVPIHTEHADDYARDLANVHRLRDGELLSV